jgi:hypothetical protein
MLFGNYEAVMYMRQVPLARLASKAQDIAAYLGLPLEIVDVGLGELEERLAELVGADGGCQLNVPSGAATSSRAFRAGAPEDAGERLG